MLMWMGLVMTVVFYWGGKTLYKKVRFVLLNPMITCLIALIVVLLCTHMSYSTYFSRSKLLTDMLNPATVALAIPLYRHFDVLKRHIAEFLLSLACGATVAVTSSVLLARVMRLSGSIALSVAPRSVTTPIAMDISQTLGGIPALTAVFVIITGLSGVILGPLIIRVCRIQSSVAKGTLFGMGCHGLGTARAFEIGQMEGTCASLSMVTAAFITLALAPVLVPLLRA
ncbi:LrgB family protein [Alicyclobacillus acidiphilus]|jgi:predicted murein hydrolase (TIGR00659 family)|uniref:LrgB family protein n=1 Tax=Alicyclobacillus acidiphilus TaxID=182455 RepID=UPI000833691F|nr:LrgB family protein [Alicyclobacillus acidiphilus]